MSLGAKIIAWVMFLVFAGALIQAGPILGVLILLFACLVLGIFGKGVIRLIDKS